MKAFIFERNGEPTDVLGNRNLPDPVPGPGEVLVRIPDLHVPVDVSDISPPPPLKD